MIPNEILRLLLGADDENNPIRDMGPEPFLLYLWMRAQTGTDRVRLSGEDGDGEREIEALVTADGCPLDIDAPQLEGCLQSLRAAGWVDGYDVDGGSARVTLGVLADTPEWAAEREVRRRIREGVFSERDDDRARAMGIVEARAVFPEEFGVVDVDLAEGEGIDEARSRMDDLDEVAGRAQERAEAAWEQKAERWEREGKWKKTKEMGTPQGVADDGTYERSKHGLWRMYLDLYRREIGTSPPSLYTDSGKPGSKAHKIGTFVKEYGIEVAMEAVRTIVERWDEIREAKRITDPPTPSQLVRLRDTVCHHVEAGNDPVAEIREVHERKGRREEEIESMEWDEDADDVDIDEELGLT